MHIFIILPEEPKLCCSAILDVITAVLMKIQVLWVVRPSRLLSIYRRFGHSVVSPSSGSNSVLESTLKIKARLLSETSVAIYQSTRRNIPEDMNLHEVSHCAVSASSPLRCTRKPSVCVLGNALPVDEVPLAEYWCPFIAWYG